MKRTRKRIDSKKNQKNKSFFGNKNNNKSLINKNIETKKSTSVNKDCKNKKLFEDNKNNK